MNIRDSFTNALSGMVAGPSDLMKSIHFQAQGCSFPKIVKEVEKICLKAPNDDCLQHLFAEINKWDCEESSKWAAKTKPNSIQRRTRIYEILKINENIKKIIENHNPIFSTKPNIKIDGPKAKKAIDWYTDIVQKNKGFYWDHLKEHLKKTKKLSTQSIIDIDIATKQVIRRLRCPWLKQPERRKGLVVGYVQSGKTTHFTGLTAKAIDCGYKLIIVLTGMTDLLRTQTQKRLDMDLCGRENILRGRDEVDFQNHDYSDDFDWTNNNFVSFAKNKRDLRKIKIQRITNYENDFEKSTVSNMLDFQNEDRKKPLWHPHNIKTDAKLIVIKKNGKRLEKLLTEIQSLKKKERNEIPALIIDDESDQASVDTLHPNKKQTPEQKIGIPAKICQIIEELPRSQYVGYTATPFANVLTNQKDTKGLFPDNFIISLEKPAGYMGPREFTDIENNEDEIGPNEKAHIRGFRKDDKLEIKAIQHALDAFVISGALKKYRSSILGDQPQFKHHTMLFHESGWTDIHKSAFILLTKIWIKSKYDHPSSTGRLMAIFDDFKQSWLIKGKKEGLPFPHKYEVLKKRYLGEALNEMRLDISSGIPLLKVNSDDDAETPDFSKGNGVWKIIVGGNKLSRGYTIEGLTISFFNRNSLMQDTLLQMGRWFGYRDKYADLVRLYISRGDKDEKIRNDNDIYHKFECICVDEEKFRERLSMYSGENAIIPRDVPALVFNSHPKMRPTSRNKMHYAELLWAYNDYREPTRQAFSNDSFMRKNIQSFKNLWNKKTIKTASATSMVPSRNGQRIVYKKRNFKFLYWQNSVEEIIKTLKEIKWENKNININTEIEFLEQHKKNHQKWVVITPLIQRSKSEKGKTPLFPIGSHKICPIRRNLLKTRINAFNSPEHVVFAKWLTGDETQKAKCTCSYLSKVKDGVNVLLFWPTIPTEDKKPLKKLPVTGFALVMPDKYEGSQKMAWRRK